jgi:hypothetical protein
MGIRITCKKELERLVKKGLIHKDVVTESMAALKGSSKAKKIKANAVSSESVCALIPVNPADMLFQALVRKYGRFYEGGLVVYELIFPFDNRRWRMDIAMPSKRVVFELDGWADHGKRLTGFKRDREKSLSFERRGWRVIRFSSAQIRYSLSETLRAIDEILTFSLEVNSDCFLITQVGFDRSLFEER